MRQSLLAGVVVLGVSVGAASSAQQTPETGSVTGRVSLTSRIPGASLPSNTYQPRHATRRSAVTIPEIKNVVVYLRDVVHRGAMPVERRQIRQEHEAFVPRVVAITRGSVVDFPNADPLFHNVFSLSSAANFDLGRYPQGKTRSPRPFAKPGLVKVYCHVHSHMSASILVLDHPYFTTPGLDGKYTLADVPPGRYTIVGWHERVGERTATVQVAAGAITTFDFALPAEELF